MLLEFRKSCILFSACAQRKHMSSSRATNAELQICISCLTACQIGSQRALKSHKVAKILCLFFLIFKFAAIFAKLCCAANLLTTVSITIDMHGIYLKSPIGLCDHSRIDSYSYAHYISAECYRAV